jgi:predicted amidohydrolase YtcJ
VSAAAADVVVIGATVERITAAAGPADAVAVAGGRIAAMGRAADVRPFIGPRTEVIELDGETLLPGFQDAHIHPIEGGLLDGRCDLHGAVDARDCLARIAAYASTHPDEPWVLGSGWPLTAFPRGEPTREALDAVLPDRPALLESNDGHCAWANSRALAVVPIRAATPDPPDGRIAREAGGEPSGALFDGAVELVASHIPPPTHEQLVAGLRAAQAHLHRLGITGWQDANVGPEQLAVYREAAEEGWLTARVVAALWWERQAGLEQIEWFEEARASAAVGRLRADSVKLMLDGIIESRTAYLTAPYEGDAWRGAPFIDPDPLREAVVDLDRRGFQAHFHAIGDGAVRLGLDVIEAARAANGASDRRHHLAHLETIHPRDVPRFAELGAAATIQPFWAVDDDQMRDLRVPALGVERARWQYPFASLRRAGARLAGGSDWTVTTANPLLEIEVATTRVDPAQRGTAPFRPEERLTLDEALEAFTLGSAWVNHLDTQMGSITVGKQADLVILDRDLRTAGTPIGEASVVTTFIAGERV